MPRIPMRINRLPMPSARRGCSLCVLLGLRHCEFELMRVVHLIGSHEVLVMKRYPPVGRLFRQGP